MAFELNWDGHATLSASCPACGHAGSMDRVVTAIGPALPPDGFPVHACAACGSLVCPTLLKGQPAPSAPSPAEMTPSDLAPVEDAAVLGCDELAVAFYLEQGAGLLSMAGQLGGVEPRRVRRFLDVGCGFGFSLDIARTMFGWEVQGVDPGPLARTGAATLGLPISHKLLPPVPAAGEEPFDLVFASEVIEHVCDPQELAASLRARLAPGGAFLLSTPNAAAVSRHTSLAVLVPALSIGHHVTLFSRAGLESLLRRVGFTAFSVVETPATLFAVAGPDAAALPDPLQPRGHALYDAYLARRAGDFAASHPLGLGLRQRILRRATQTGAIVAALPVGREVADAVCAGWGIDLANPDAILADPPPDATPDAYHDTAPFCLPGLLLWQGILAWRREDDPARAGRLFEAAALVADRARAALRRIGADDGDTARVGWEARVYAAQMLTRRWPEEAERRLHAALATDAPPEAVMPTDLRVELALRVFAGLAESGHEAMARRLAPLVAATLPGDTPRVARARDLACRWRDEAASRRGTGGGTQP
ncbi:class I SAM-dependent methyltransferase [Azospirillum brasilense]|uniref:class I SAM-dependent methyltransferase n=1 Tax=Azospirillum brasilense TaxID=192 RepID=UPI0011AAEC20|nr:class I SAM-dependent methyltransferase [Azospirillum brasilense]